MTSDLILISRVMYIRVKKVILILTALLLFGSAFAQDVLILKSGKELRVNIVEEGTDLIKYREFSNPSGPLYSVSKVNVASIKYGKGSEISQSNNKSETAVDAPGELSKDNNFNMLTAKKKNVYLNSVVQAPRSVSIIMEDHPEALQLYESGRTLYRLGNICPVGILVTSYIFSKRVNEKETSEERIRAGIPGLVIDGGFVIAAVIMYSAGKSKIKSSVNMYNSAISKPVSFRLDFGIQESGVGLALKF